MLRDLRFAARMFARTPAFTAFAVVTLAVGIGGASSVFTLFRAVFLTPLPFPAAERIVTISERREGSRRADIPVSGHEYAAWVQESRTFEHLALFRPDALTRTGPGEPETIAAVHASAKYFHVFGVEPALGRAFSEGEDQPGGARVVILSDEFWRRRFGSDPAVIGQHVLLDDEQFTIVGVMGALPKAMSTDVWLPLDVPAQIRAVGRHNLGVVARLAPGASLAQAQADLASISERVAERLPDSNAGHFVNVAPLRERMVGEYRDALTLLLSAVGFVLLIASANLANLLLTRGAGRQREIAVRAAIGAGRGALVRQFLVESVLLALLGGAAGLLLAVWIVDLLPKIVVLNIPLVDQSRIDPHVIGVCAALSLFTGFAIGIAPALRAARSDLNRSLLTGHGIADDRTGNRLRSLLVASEVAWTMILLVGAGLMLNSFVRLVHVAPGFSEENVLVLAVDLPASRYANAERRRALLDDLHARVGSVPGVSAAGAVSHLPLGGADNWMPFAVAGRPAPAPGQELYAAVRVATPDYFRAMGIPLRAGRLFGAEDRRLAIPVIRWFPQQPLPPLADRSQAPPVALISEEAARRFWPGEDPVGQRIRVLFSPDVTVVGIVADVRHHGLNMPIAPHIYLPHSQEPWGSLSFVVKTSVPPESIASSVVAQLRALDPLLPARVRTMEEVRAGTVTHQRFYVLLVGLFSLVALGLALVGIYGVVSFAAAQRTTEIGVRLALGATPREIVSLVVSQTLRPIALGIVAGIGGALALSGFIEQLLFGVRPADPLTFTAVVALLAIVALAACWIPARRAARLDPLIALRTL